MACSPCHMTNLTRAINPKLHCKPWYCIYKNYDMRISCYNFVVAFTPQLTKHWEDECTEFEMTCPLKKFAGCNFKVCMNVFTFDIP